VKMPNNPRFEILNFIIYGMFAIANLAMINGAEVADMISGLALLLTILNIKRLATWYIKGIWRKPLLWTLFLAYSFIVLGFALYALLYFGWFNIFIPIHAVAVGGIGLLTLSMMARVSLGHSGRPLGVPVASGAAGPRGGQRLLHRGHQPGRPRAALGHRRVLRHELFLRPTGTDHSPGVPGQGRGCGSRSGPGDDPRSEKHLAVLPGPQARHLPGPGEPLGATSCSSTR
ncbi:MAG: NnrS family protein, partial [Chloroflexi bacterium]|nr:NnrS family protein [Chloroflexota bacterium]